MPSSSTATSPGEQGSRDPFPERAAWTNAGCGLFHRQQSCWSPPKAQQPSLGIWRMIAAAASEQEAVEYICRDEKYIRYYRYTHIHKHIQDAAPKHLGHTPSQARILHFTNPQEMCPPQLGWSPMLGYFGLVPPFPRHRDAPNPDPAAPFFQLADLLLPRSGGHLASRTTKSLPPVSHACPELLITSASSKGEGELSSMEKQSTEPPSAQKNFSVGPFQTETDGL